MMIKIIIRYVVALSISAFPLVATSVYAAEVRDLYRAQVVVSDQTSDTRDAAMASAFSQVLVKVTGDQTIAHNSQVQSVLQDKARLSTFIESYRYQPNDEQLSVEFGLSPQAINQFLRNNHLPIWSSNRPVTLAWLAIEEDQERHIVNSSDVTIEPLLQQEANRRGIPLLLPLMDLEDSARVTVMDIWGQFTHEIQNASNRYASDAVLIGRLYSRQNVWVGQWVLLQGDAQSAHWQTQGQTLSSVLADGVDETASRLAFRYATALTDQSAHPLIVQISNIQTVQDYAAVEHYFKTLTDVSQIQLHQASVDTLTYELKIYSTPEQFQQTIALNPVLLPEHSGSTNFSHAATRIFTYRWFP